MLESVMCINKRKSLYLRIEINRR